ncbi:MAG: hypothetical protein H0V82_09225 [Candidatus Protochlamydia sp.]|nr:hypothetical protein [Candidatus Protochlamydia sp.]
MIINCEEKNSPLLCDIYIGNNISLKLLIYPFDSTNVLMSLCNSEKSILPFLNEMKEIITAAQGHSINHKVDNQIKFVEAKTMHHENMANIDFNFLNNTFNSYQNTEYLKDFIESKKANYMTMKSNLEKLVVLFKSNQLIKLNEKDSQRLRIQLTQVLKKLQESDPQELRRFVCELAYLSKPGLCGPGIADMINFEYKSLFNLLEGSNLSVGKTIDSIFIEMYQEAIYETIETLLKLSISPISQSQSVHVRYYLWNELKKHFNIPSDPLNDSLVDTYQHEMFGSNDFPPEEIKQIYEAFFIPLLIQILLRKGTMPRVMIDNSKNYQISTKNYQLLLEGFVDLIVSNLNLDSDSQSFLTGLDEEREYCISEFNSKLDQLNAELNQLLINPIYLEKDRIERTCQNITDRINTLACESILLHAELEDIKHTLNSPQDEKTSSMENKKRTFDEITSIYQGTHLDLLNLAKSRIEYKLEELDKQEKRLKAHRQIMQISIQQNIEPLFQNLAELKKEISKIQKEKEEMLHRCNHNKREFIWALCEKNGWLLMDNELGIPNLTPAGAVKFLEIKEFLIKEEGLSKT